jgi:hypothetical protein
MDPPLQQRRDPIWNGQNDTGGPANDAVVRLNNNGSCTGTLVTSTLVLTAAHCVTGWSGYSGTSPGGAVAPGGLVNVGVDSSSFLPIQSENGATEAAALGSSQATVIQVASLINGPLTPGNEGRDLALARIFPPIVAQAYAKKPTFLAPAVPSTPVVFSTFTLVGWGMLSNGTFPTIRQTLTQDQPLGLKGFDFGSLGRVWYFSSSSPYNGPAPGDSGGPLFWQSGPGAPQLGVASLGGPPSGGASWADITSAVAQDFLNTTAADPNRPGKWLGETDYVGPCDLVNDPDCDRFYDTIPGTGERGGDNCPNFYNPAQFDSPDLNGNGLPDDGPKQDQDGDGIPDYCDHFPTCGLTFTDADGDGVCDRNDLCPCSAVDQDPAQSDDKDGHCGPCSPGALGNTLPNGQTCATWCTNHMLDLCPGVPDEYGNDNEDSERVWNGKPLGNACDPVPVPDFLPKWGEVVGQVVTSGGSGTGNWLVTKKYVRASAIKHRLRGSRGALDSPIPGQGQAVSVPNTYHRFCLDKKINNIVDITCALDNTIADDFLIQDPKRSEEGLQTRWHRVTMQGSFTGPTGSWENPSLQNFTYQPSPSPFSLSWRLVDDFNAWISTTWGQALELEVPSPSSTKTWSGRFWMHSNSLVGLSTNIGTGLHKKNNGDPGEQLSNHYELLDPIQLQETATVWDIPMYMPAFAASFCPACVAELPPLGGDDCPMCKGLLPGSLLDHPYEIQLLAKLPPLPDFPFQYAVVLKDGSFYSVDDKLGAGLKQALSDPTQIWAEQTEPLSHLGRGATLPTALALSADGRAITERVSLRGHRFLGQRDRGRTGAVPTVGEEPSDALPSGEPLASSSPALQPSERTSFLPVYSRYLGRLFVVGGQNPVNSSLRGDIWWQDVEGATSWHRLPDQGYTVGKVLAATYSFRDDRLWVLDEVQGPFGLKRIRLVRIHPQSGEFEQLGQWPRVGLFNRHWLGVDKDGQVLLTASSDTAKKYLVIRLDNRAPQVKPSSVRFGQGALALRPLVDQDGYSFVLRETKKNRPPTKTERSKTLGGIPAGWSHLNGCW